MIGGGAFVCRFGVNNTFENNWMENCKGIWVADKNCVASGNRLLNSDISVLAGDVTSAQTASREGTHPRSEYARLSNNAARRTTIGAWGSLHLPAIYGQQSPELAAAALYQTMRVFGAWRDDAAQSAIRRELLGQYGQTYYGAKVMAELSAKSPSGETTEQQ